ncbi:hypothetical protein Pla52o_32240 [Novipirellula galeiformis]|uniref:Uncharacterized protein n=1 Tax=Novipirellula galeiformis TaxID=2528004 RepID=A0A5C6CC56_9BACT|nr:hypothetical protein Pla52o_32240 [Novipirellula galeiformis]
MTGTLDRQTGWRRSESKSPLGKLGRRWETRLGGSPNLGPAKRLGSSRISNFYSEQRHFKRI